MAAPWEYGVATEFPGINLWVTALLGDYQNNTGEALVSPPFVVDGSTNLVEVYHFYDFENNYDGCNLEINGQVVEPTDGYDVPELSTSTGYYAYCVDLEPGFTDDLLTDFTTTCWDISAFAGQEIQLEFTIGTDSSVTYPGWFLASVTVGGYVTADTNSTWGQIKSLYR